MNQKNKKRRFSFLYNSNNLKNLNKFKRKRNSIVGSPVRNTLELNRSSIQIKRSGTNFISTISDLNDSRTSINVKDIKNISKKRKSLKYIEKNIKNKLLDISLQIEKEENDGNISCIISKKNNLDLSTFIKRHIDGESDFSKTPKHRAINNKFFKLNRNSEVKRMKLSISDTTTSKISLLQKSEINIGNSISKIPYPKINDKFRVLLQKNILYDSFDSEEENQEEDEIFYISPKSSFIVAFDSLILIFCLFDIIYTPFRMSKINGFCSQLNEFISIIYYLIDILYIIDFILGFIKSYYNFQFTIIKNKSRIVRHYIKTQFWLDFLEALPVFTYISFLNKINKNFYCNAYDLDNMQMILLLFCFVKQVKFFKIIDLKNNAIMYKIKESIIEKEYIEDILNMLITTGICIFCFYSFISIHIFIGRHSYPNWISKNGFENQSHSLLYFTSFYYLITTMTTVGYGDIVCAGKSETIFQIIVLSVGITVYSWVVSNIGNYVKNESYASMQYNKDGEILEEIRITHPNMPFKLYKQILQHLNARKIRQKHCDSNLLINSLPYSLKNSLLLTMYRNTIENLKIFKGCKNSDFIVRLLTNFIPLFSKKNAILIHEGQLVENIMFVKNGRLSLQAAIDIEVPEESIKHYLNKNFGDISDDLMFLSKYESSNSSSSNSSKVDQTPVDIAKTVFDSIVNTRTKSPDNSEINESGLGKEMGKWDFGGEDFEESNYQFINIINISKNESYGVVYMFLSKPSPLSLRVKSKKVELLLLRKIDAMDISQRYPNIWMKFLKKSYFNILSIKKIAVNKIQNYWDNIEKTKQKKQIMKCKTNLNSCRLFKLKNSSIEETKKSEDNSNKFLSLKNSKTNEKKIKTVKSNRLTVNVSEMLNSKSNIKPKVSTPNFSNVQSNYLKVSNNNLKVSSKFATSFREKESVDNNNNNINNNNKSEKNSFVSSTNFNSDKMKNINSPSKKSFNISKNRNNKSNKNNNDINKLKTQIEKLKNSKKYYKKLCEELTFSKGIDNNYVNNNFNQTLLKTFSRKHNSVLGPNEQINQNINIFNNLNPNIINNITIQNSNKFLCKSNNKDISSDLKFSESEKTENSTRKFDLNEMSINSEINIFYKAKYINLEVYTSGEYSKNDELRKQSLNFIKVFLQIEKKKNRRIQKSYTKNIKEKDKLFNPYINNYDFRYIFNKLNIDLQKKSSHLNTIKTINTKKDKCSNNLYLLTANANENKNNSFMTLIKNNNKEYKREKSKKTKNSNLKLPVTQSKYKKTFFSVKDKQSNYVGEQKEKRKRKVSLGFLKLPVNKHTINEWEQELSFSKSENENEIDYDISKSISRKSFDINNNSNKDNSILNTFKQEIYSSNSHKSVDDNQILHLEPSNESSSKN